MKVLSVLLIVLMVIAAFALVTASNVLAFHGALALLGNPYHAVALTSAVGFGFSLAVNAIIKESK